VDQCEALSCGGAGSALDKFYTAILGSHPSVVMWSIGNEISEQAHSDGGRLAQKLTDIVHAEDRTRPTTAA
jgi:hypothetical protein